MAPKTSHLQPWFDRNEEFFGDIGPQTNVVLPRSIDFSQESNRQLLFDLRDELEASEWFLPGGSQVWLEPFRDTWLSGAFPATRRDFEAQALQFVQSSNFSTFADDLQFDDDGVLVASRFTVLVPFCDSLLVAPSTFTRVLDSPMKKLEPTK